MAHILEFVDATKTYSAAEVVENEITHLICRMSDYKDQRADEVEKAIIEDWRKELVIIRNAVRKLGGI
jgi:hypothetical protein